MAGGEVTPDGLIAVGQIAKKYNLYTKITGGQRVDYLVRKFTNFHLFGKS
jgi:NAD(P)H-nitrite reductase large subunit